MTMEIIMHEIDSWKLTLRQDPSYKLFLHSLGNEFWDLNKFQQEALLNLKLRQFNAHVTEWDLKRVSVEFGSQDDFTAFVLTWS